MAAVESRAVTAVQSNLHQQDLTKLDVTKLTAVSPEVISRQATINIGTIGHVAHGKSTVVKAISGVQTVRFKNELERNITIKLERLPEAVIRAYQVGKVSKEKKSLNNETKASKRKSTHTPDKKRKKIKGDKINGHLKNRTKNKDSNEYIVEEILEQEVRDGVQMFFIKWKNYSHDLNTWEPVENLDNCPKLMNNFLLSEVNTHKEKIEQLEKEISFGDLLSRGALEKLLKTNMNVNKSFDFYYTNILALINLKTEEESHVPRLIEETRRSLQMYTLLKLRRKQLEQLKEWEKYINSVDTSKRLLVQNDVDLEVPPINFRYINVSEPGKGVVIPTDPPISCDCNSCTIRSKCSCGVAEALFAYHYNKRLRVPIGTPIYECNKKCKCSADCHNRVVQKGRVFKLKIFRTATGCGWGVKSEQRILKGHFVCQYIGEVITGEEAEMRSKANDSRGLTYLFDLDFNSDDNPYTVDAENIGNVSHFINHSCDPNLAVWAVFADCLDPNLPLLALFAIRDINPGEEICFDYEMRNNTKADSEFKKEESVVRKLIYSPQKEDCSNMKEDAKHGSECVILSVPEDAKNSPRKLMTSRISSPSKIVIDSHIGRNECKCGSIKCRKHLF